MIERVTQVTLRCGNRTATGFVQQKFAAVGRQVRLDGAEWTVEAVYATWPRCQSGRVSTSEGAALCIVWVLA